jgi:putative PIN family toxin of toxin-antitoxin system
MRAVLDTNVIVSGLVWGGPPRHLLDLARRGTLTLYTSAALLDELRDVLSREKFAARLAARNRTPNGIARGYVALARSVAAPTIPRTVPADADDDAVLACALAAHADLIVTGDRDLLILNPFRAIAILKPADALAWLQTRD